MRPPDDGPTVPVTVTPEDLDAVARQFSDAADGFARLRENLWNGLRPAAGWAGVDEQARRFGQQFTDAYMQLETGIERARGVLCDIGQGIDLAARNHWLADQSAIPGATPGEPPWATAPPGPFIATEVASFPLVGNATFRYPPPFDAKIPAGDPERLRTGARAFYDARSVVDALIAALYGALYGLFEHNDSEDLRALDEFWQRVGGRSDKAILTAIRDGCDALGRGLDDFASWIVDTNNEIDHALQDVVDSIFEGVLIGLALAALTEGLGAFFGLVGGAGAAGEIVVVVNGVITAAGVAGRLAAIGGVVGGVIGLMQVAIDNTPNPNLSVTDPQVVTDAQVTSAAEEVADVATGTSEVPGSAGDGEILTPHGRAGTVSDLNPAQLANYNRYVKKLPAKAEPTQIEVLADGGIRMSSRVPANNIPGSYAEYIKIVDGNGNTVQYVKNTYDASGKIVHSKVK